MMITLNYVEGIISSLGVKSLQRCCNCPPIVLHILKTLFQGYKGKENIADLIKI